MEHRRYGVMIMYPDTNIERVIRTGLTREQAQEEVEQLRHSRDYPEGSFFMVADLEVDT